MMMCLRWYVIICGRSGIHIVVALRAALKTGRLRRYLRIHAGGLLTRCLLVTTDAMLTVCAGEAVFEHPVVKAYHSS